MGFNTALVFCNDGLGELDRDPNAGKKIAALIRGSWGLRRGESESGSIGNYANPISCLTSLHADEIQIVAVGGNRIQYLGYGGGYASTPEAMLKELADQMGFRLVAKKKREPTGG